MPDPKLIFRMRKISFIAERFAAFATHRFPLLSMLFIILSPYAVESYSFHQSQAMVGDAILLFDKLRRMTSKITASYSRRAMTYSGQSWGVVAQAFEDYLHSPKAEMLQGTTRADYIATVREHTGLWWSREAASITPLDAKELFAELKASGMSLGHLSKIKVVINRIFNFGIENRLIHGNDRSHVYRMKLGKDSEKKPEILTLAEIRKLLQEARQLDHPWYPVWALAILTGMRSGELYALAWADSSNLSRLESLASRAQSHGRLSRNSAASILEMDQRPTGAGAAQVLHWHWDSLGTVPRIESLLRDSTDSKRRSADPDPEDLRLA